MSRTVRMAHSSHGAGNAPTSLAIAEGYFSDYDIDAVIEEVPRTSDGVAKVVAGDADFAIAAGAPILQLAMRGHDPLVVMSIEQHNIFAVIGAKGITGPEDLRGGRVGILGPEDSDGLLMQRALLEWGIDPHSEVEVVQCNGRGDQWDAVVEGRVDAMATAAPQPIMARRLGLPILRDYADQREAYQLGSVVTTRSYADANPELVRDYMTATVKGVKAFCADFDLALPHLKARAKLEDIEILQETHKVFSRALEHYVPRAEALANVARDLAAVTGRTVDLDVEQYVDASFVSGTA